MAKPENIVTSITVVVEAPASVVWEVLTDLKRYEEWNPFTVRVESTLQVNQPVDLYIAIPGQAGQQMCVREWVIAVEPERLLSWEQRATAEDKNCARRDQVITTLGPERCSYYTTDIFLGVHEDQVMRDFGGWVKASFDQVAIGVKRQAESIYAARRKR